MRSARVGAAHGAGLRREQRAAAADHVVHLGLAEDLVDGDAQLVARPFRHCIAHRLAAAHQAAQGELEATAGPGHLLEHHLERRGEQERVAYGVLLQQVKGALRVEPAAIGEDGQTEVQGRQQRVEQPAGPGPVCRRPEHVAGLREEVVRADEARQIPEQGAMRDQGALRRAGGAAGVDDQRRVVGGGVGRLVAGAGTLEQVLPCMHAALAGTGHTDHMPEAVELGTRAPQFRQRVRVHDRSFRAGVAQAVGECVRSEQMRQRHRDSAHLEDRHVGDGCLGPLRQEQRNAIAGPNAQPLQGICEPVSAPVQVPVGEGRGGAALVFEIEREALAAARMAAAAVPGDVVTRRNLPAEARVQLLVARRLVHGVEREGRLRHAHKPRRLPIRCPDTGSNPAFVHPGAGRPKPTCPGSGFLRVFVSSW